MTFELPKFKDYIDQPVKYIQAKMDGHMYYIRVDEQGIITCMTKNGKDKTEKLLAIKHIQNEIGSLPYRTELFAELHCHGVLATSVPTMLNDADERLKLSVFAAPMVGGIDLYHERLPSVMAGIKNLGFDTIPVTLATSGFFNETGRENMLQLAIEKNIEGWVLKESHMEGWYKLKPVRTIDAFITDHQVSDSKTYKGCLKSMSLGLMTLCGDVHDLGECGGGFTKEFKLSLNTVQLRNNLIDKVVEIAYDSATAGNKLRFPRFVRFRDDKDMDDCTVEQLG